MSSSPAQNPPSATKSRAAITRPLAVRNFRLLWIGETTSLFGDQAYGVALPWLILGLTSSGAKLGLVLMAAAIPRAIFMLVGGVVVDRLNPRLVMIGSNVLRLLAVSTLALLVMSHTVQMWHVLALALVFGFAEAFFFPAYTSMVPSLVQMDMFAAANALLTISFQMAMIAGPPLAGLIIAKFDTAPTLWADAATFVVSLSMLVLLRPAQVAKQAARSMRGSLADGARYVWGDPVIRSLILGFSAINFSTFGPFFVGMPVIAKTQFGSATALGTMFAFYGFGALFGGGIGGSIKKTPSVGPLLLSMSIAASLAMFGLGVLPVLWQMCAVLFVTGATVGFGRVFVMALLQGRAQPQMIGRVMSFVMFGAVGSMPISFALTGLLVSHSIRLMFSVAGISALVLGTLAAMARPLWTHAQNSAPETGSGTTSSGSAA